MLPNHLLEKIENISKKHKFTDKQKNEIIKKTEESYENSRIAPGEAIGVVTAESFGEPGTQMSEKFDEKVIIKFENKIKIIEIGKFVDGLMEKYGKIDLDFTQVLPINNLEFYVPSLNQDEKTEWKKISEISRHKYTKKLMKLTTTSGRTITATDNHSFVTRQNNQVIKIVGRELKIGDRIPVINNFYTNDYLKEIKISDSFVDNRIIIENDIISKPGAKPVKNIIELNSNSGWFVGAYLSEGSGSGSQIGISNINDNYINNAKEFITNIGLNYTEDYHHRGFAESRDLKVSSVFLNKFITSTCGVGSDFKKVPDFAYSTSNEFVSGLLRGYFDGDGNFYSERNLIRASSNSRELRDGIALLLSRFKIFSYKTTDKKGQHWLLIPYKYAPQYLEFIGSDIDYKLKDLEIMADKAKKFWNTKSQDYTDMISGFGNLFYDTAKKLGYRTRYINNFTKRQKIGRTALYKYIKIFKNIAIEKNIDIKNELEIMNRMFSSDVIWDSIEKIEYVENEYEYVYDFSVPGLETFTTFDGIITHNTLDVFHFAGVAEMQVTVGLPRLMEIFDARKRPSTPEMRIPIKPKYAKNTDMVRELAMKIKETKLVDISQEISINVAKNNVDIVFDKKKMRELDIKPKEVLVKVTEAMKGIDVKETDNGLLLKPKDKEIVLSEVYKLKEKAKMVHVKGLVGITHVLPVKDDEGNYIIHSAGSNLKEALLIEEVEKERITTNDIFEVYDILGIEAARAAIIQETIKVLKDQGIDVDVRHTMFLADIMTKNGNIKGITRTGITGEKESVLARASFETPIKHIINASLIGERDDLNSVVENVILNQPIPLGTGLPGLIAKTEKDKK